MADEEQKKVLLPILQVVTWQSSCCHLALRCSVPLTCSPVLHRGQPRSRRWSREWRTTADCTLSRGCVQGKLCNAHMHAHLVHKRKRRLLTWQPPSYFSKTKDRRQQSFPPALLHTHTHSRLLPCHFQALEFSSPAEPIRGLIKALFDQCEKDKPLVQPNEAADKEYVKNFAITVFNRADKLDRAKRADINTAKCFYAAAIFLQVGAYRCYC